MLIGTAGHIDHGSEPALAHFVQQAAQFGTRFFACSTRPGAH